MASWGEGGGGPSWDQASADSVSPLAVSGTTGRSGVARRGKGLAFVFVPFFCQHQYQYRAFLEAQTVKYLPTMRETQVRSLDQEDLLEKGMATHSSILAWKIPWTEEPGRLQSMGSQRVRLD